MAQGNPRPRHGRHQSRILRMMSSGNTSGDENHHTAAAKQAGRHDETVRYIKRTLCQSAIQQGPLRGEQNLDTRPLEELLPPLTSSNEVDVQLYGIIAVILSNFVQSWYNRITSDQDFVAEVVQIIAHCTRGLEQRLRHVDLEDLILDELPALLISHIEAEEVARGACSGPNQMQDARLVYHSIYSHAALAPVPHGVDEEARQDENEIAWSQLLVSRVLPLLLPPEDLQNPCLHVLVSEIFSEMIVHRVLCQRVSEPWLLWEGVTRAIQSLKPELAGRSSPPRASSPVGRLQQYGLLASQEAAAGRDRRETKAGTLDAVTGAFWAALQFVTITWLFLRSTVFALAHASSLPARSSHAEGGRTSDKPPVSAVNPPEGVPDPQGRVTQGNDAFKRPVVRMRVWTCISTLTHLDQRMPWLSGLLSLSQWISLHGPGQVCRTDGPLDRLLSSHIRAKLLRPEYLPPMLQAIRHAVFPDNALAAARLPPTPDQVDEIKHTCAETIVKAVPEAVRSRFFATDDEALMRADVESTLELFGDRYINKHLIVALVELLVVRLFPELSEDGAGD